MKKILLTIAACLGITTIFSQCPLAVSIGADTTVCQAQYTIPLQVSGSFGTVSYQWFKNGLPISNPSILPIEHADHDTYTVYVNDGSGCQSSDTAIISVYNAYNDTVYSCWSNVDTLDLGSGAFQYSWFSYIDSNGQNSSISGTTRYYYATEPGTYYAMASYNACGTLTSTIYLHPDCAPQQPACINVFSSTRYDFCGYDSLYFVGTGNPQPTSWYWDFGDGSTANTVGYALHGYYVSGIYLVSLTTQDANGCSYTSHDTINVLAGSNFSVSLLSDTSLCQSQLCISGQISGNVQGSLQYQWSDGDTSDTRCFSNEYNKTISLTVYDSYSGCSSTDSITFSVFNPIIGDTFYLCNNGSTTLDFGPGPQGTHYFWQTYTDTNGITYNISDLPSSSINDTLQTITVMWPGQYFGFAIFPGCGALTSIFNVGVCNETCDAIFTYMHNQVVCGDSVLILAAGGNEPGSLYSWNFGDGTQLNDSSLTLYHYYTSSGTYTIHLSVSNSSCIDSFNAPIVIQGNLLQVNAGQDRVECQTNGGLVIDPLVSGGASPYSFNWSNGSQQPTTVVNNVADYLLIVFVTDANGCWDADSVNVTELSDTTITYSACQSPLQYCAPISYASYYLWSTGDSTACISPSVSNGFGLTYGLPNSGCTSIHQNYIITPCVQNDSVWPGDANADGVVTNFDIINLGLAYNQTGPLRSDQSIGWYSHTANLWNLFFSYGVNTNHADCNGNGTINANDTLAVYQNYLLTHQKVENTVSSSNPLLYIQALSDTLGLNQMAVFKIMLTNSPLTIDSIYGVSFTLNYNSINGQSNTAGLDFSSSWLAPVGNQLSFQKSSQGSIDIALTRINQTNANGDGEVGTFMIVTTDNLSGINDLKVSLEDARALTLGGSEILLGIKNDSIFIDALSIHEMEALTEATSIFPNPANDKFWVNCPEKIQKFELIDFIGKNVLSSENKKEEINVSALGRGCYQLKITCEKGIIYKKVILK